MTEVASVAAGEDGGGRSPLFEGEPRTVSLSLDADDRVPEHEHPERTVLFHVLEGAIDLDVGDETLALEAGDVARFDGDQGISPAARTDARALVILAPSD